MSPVRVTKRIYWLTLSSLFTPFVWIKIGPKGIAYYGPNVPDIYFLAAFVTGKDRSFPGIAFAIIFQLIMVFLFIHSASRAESAALQERWRELHAHGIFQLILLVLFPFWMVEYVKGVINNSDGAAADLSVLPHIGVLTYVILVMHVVGILKFTGSKVYS